MEKRKNVVLDLNTPLLPLNALLDLLEIKESERSSAIALILTVATKENHPDESPELIRVYKEMVKMLPSENAKKIQAILNKITAARKSFLQDQKRIFYSLDDAVDAMIKSKGIPGRLVCAMLGGKWPKHPFNFCCVNSFMIEKDGTLVPDDGMGESAPGPDFKLQFKMTNDPLGPAGSLGH